MIPDTTYLRYRGSPCSDEFNGFKLNSRGYKDVAFNEKKEADTFRILALGDSQTYGAVPYQECYITIVEQTIRRSYPHCEILNMGVPSAGPVDYLSVLLNEGLDLNPDMVLLNFNIFDDFKNGGKRFKLYSYSAAASYINSIIANCLKPRGLTFGAGIYREGFMWRSADSYLSSLIDSHGWIFQKNNIAFPHDFSSSFKYVEKIKALCDAKKITLVAVIIPADLQLYPFLQKKAIEHFHAKDDDFDFQIPDRMLIREFERLRIPYLDLLGYFQNRYRAEGKNLTQGNDPHWNRYGSKTAAEAVSPWLMQQIGRQLHSPQ